AFRAGASSGFGMRRSKRWLLSGPHVRADVFPNDRQSPLGPPAVKEEHQAHGRKSPRGRRGTCHRFHDCAGAPTCSRRKRGNQKQEALGRSRGGFSTKIHLRTNANGEPLTFDGTGGEAHEVKDYEALIELHDVDPERLLGDKGYDSDAI